MMDPICWCLEKHGVQYTTSVEATVAGEGVPFVPRKMENKDSKKYDSESESA